MSDAPVREVLSIVGKLAVRQVQARIRNNLIKPSTNKAGTTLVEKRHLYRSLKHRIEGSQIVISAGSPTIPYARIHHEGGTIRPKNAKYLAIPLTAKAKTEAPRNYPGETFIAKGCIFEKLGDKIVPIYALKKEVVIPARPYMFLDDDDVVTIKEAVKGWLEAQIQGGRNA